MVSQILSDASVYLKKYFNTIGVESISFSEIVYGLAAVGVRLSIGSIGTCFSAAGEAIPSQSGLWERAGDLIDTPVWEVTNWANHDNLYDRALGIATLNALSDYYRVQTNYKIREKTTLIESLQVQPLDRVGIIGYMAPVVQRLLEHGAKPIVIDKNPKILKAAQTGKLLIPVYPDSSSLGAVNHLVTTAACLVYHSFDQLRKDSNHCSSIALLGPTANLPPKILFKYGVKVIGTHSITDQARTMQVLKEGGLPGSKNNCAHKIWLLATDNKSKLEDI